MKRLFFCLSAVFFILSPIWAEEIELEKIVVTPSRIEEPSQATASTIHVLLGKELEEKGVFFIKDALREINGIDLASSGGLGAATSIFLRGANGAQTRVMIDGVKIYDPSSVDASYDFAHLAINNVEKIEILKGPQSSLYGSDAMAGVINIITKKGYGRPKILWFSEGGSFYSFYQILEMSGQQDKFHFSFGASRFDTKGFSKAKEKNNNPEDDPYQNTSISLRLDYDLLPALTLALINRYNHSRTEYDDYDFINHIPIDDPDRISWNDEGFSSFLLEQKIADFYKHKIQFSFTHNYRRGEDNNDEYERDWYRGKTYQFNWQIELDLTDFEKIVTGIDYLREKADTYYYHGLFGESDFPKSTANIKGFFLENKLNLFKNLYFNTVYRKDRHSNFKDHDTYKIEVSYLIDKTHTRLKGLFGTGFKNPSLYQLYAPAMWGFPVGNPHLKPEESEGYEGGFEQEFFDKKILFAVSYFHTNFKNLIDYVFGTGYINLNKAKTRGIETNLKFKKDNFYFSLGYSWLDTENKQTGEELLRRAKNKVNFDFNWNFSRWDLNFQLGYVGHRRDYPEELLKSYVLANLSLNYKVNKNFIIFGRIENLFNQKYEEIKGYQTPKFSIYGGFKLEF